MLQAAPTCAKLEITGFPGKIQVDQIRIKANPKGHVHKDMTNLLEAAKGPRRATSLLRKMASHDALHGAAATTAYTELQTNCTIRKSSNMEQALQATAVIQTLFDRLRTCASNLCGKSHAN